MGSLTLFRNCAFDVGMPWTRFEAWLKDTKTLSQAPEWLFQISTQAGWKFGMEEVVAIDV